MPRLLFLGDVVGRPGRRAVSSLLPSLRERHGIDLVIVNGENSASGAGINSSIVRELRSAGVDGITLGDHCWDQRGFDREIDDHDCLCRPANLPPQCPGNPWLIVEKGGFRLGVFTVLGRQFMKINAEDPFATCDRILTEYGKEADAWLVEVHAETTSEKIAMGWFLDGRASAVLGTHTHVPTADARVLPRGTAYITDVGMSGPYESVLGRNIQAVVARFIDGMPRRFEVATGDIRLCGAIVDIEARGGRATAIERVEVPVQGS